MTASFAYADKKPDTPVFPWFALKVRTRSEHVAVSALRHKGYDPFAPTYQKRRLYSDRVKTVDFPVFPGYVFCRFDPAKKFAVLNSPAVNYVVGFGGAMTSIPDEDIDAIRRAVGAGANPVPYLTVGQRVRIERGSLAGLEGRLIRSDGGTRVVISIDMLQRSIAVHIDANDLTAV
jgi:transcription antitermination factor NusG